jgi:hypothetical protein
MQDPLKNNATEDKTKYMTFNCVRADSRKRTWRMKKRITTFGSVELIRTGCARRVGDSESFRCVVALVSCDDGDSDDSDDSGDSDDSDDSGDSGDTKSCDKVLVTEVVTV